MNPTPNMSSIDGYDLPPMLPPGKRAPAGSEAADTSTHSIRVSRKLWQAFVARANAEGYTPAYAMTLLLYAWGDLSYEEVAVALGVPVGTVKSRLNRVRRQLAPPGSRTSARLTWIAKEEF